MGISTLKKRKGAAEAYHDFLQYNEKEKAFTIGDFSGGVCTRETTTGKNTVASVRNMQVNVLITLKVVVATRLLRTIKTERCLSRHQAIVLLILTKILRLLR